MTINELYRLQVGNLIYVGNWVFKINHIETMGVDNLFFKMENVHIPGMEFSTSTSDEYNQDVLGSYGIIHHIPLTREFINNNCDRSDHNIFFFGDLKVEWTSTNECKFKGEYISSVHMLQNFLRLYFCDERVWNI